MTFPVPETFEVDITNTKKLLEGERGQVIAQKDVIVSIFFDTSLVKSKRKEKKRKKVRFLCLARTIHAPCYMCRATHRSHFHKSYFVAQILIQTNKMNQ